MEIVIHGTKGGRKIFTTNKLAGLLDVTSDSPKTSAIGQSTYAIRYISNSTIFSKYKIIRDVRGDKRTGFVAFSLFISKNEKLSGAEIIALLDKVSEEYCHNYIIDNNLNEVIEDWDFVKTLSSEYLNKITKVSFEDIENLQSDNLDEAFIYYSEAKLQKYFDQPHQEKYIPYRQIFFVSDKLKNTPENPLNALRNSGVDLTGEIDLENPPLTIRDFDGYGSNDISITIKKSDGTILKKGSKVYKNDILKVIYSKKYYFHEPIEGNLNNENVHKYLKIRDENKIDVERNFNSFKPVEKTIEFEIVKKDGTEVLNPIITCKNGHQPPKEIINKKATFIGEQLNEKWEVSVRDNDYEGQISIFPEEKNTEKIILTRKRHVKIEVQDEKGEKIIYEYKVFCQNHRDSNKTLSAIDFVDEEIKKTWNIHIYGNNDYKDSESRKFCPETDRNELIFNLKKINSLKKINNGTKIIDDGNELKGQQEETSIFKKPKFIIFSIVSVLILCIGIWGLSHYLGKPKNPEEKITAEQINEYIEGDKLILSKLNDYKANWEKQNPQNNTKDEGVLSSFLSDNENSDLSVEIDNWNKIGNSIDSAISKRELIDKKDFEELKKIHFNYQESFEKTIDKVKKNKYKLLKEKLGDISSLSLAEIETKIELFLNKQVSKKNSTVSPVNQGLKTSPKVTVPQKNSEIIKTVNKEKNENKGQEKTGENNKGTSLKNAHNDTDGKSINTTSDISSDIKKYLKGDEIKYYKLEEYKSKIDDRKINESITIALKLWVLDLTETKDKKDYLNQIESNSYLRGSKLNQFVKNSIKKDLKKWNRNKSLKEISNENN
jgi:hypothetical protein